MLTQLHAKLKNAIAECLLQFKSRQFNIVMFNTISNVNHTDWHKATNGNLFWSVAYHSALEQGCSKNVSFRYFLIYDNGVPVAAYYFQLIDLKNQTLKNILNPAYFENIYQKLNGLSTTYVFGESDKNKSVLSICGNLFVSGNYGISTTDADVIKSSKKTLAAITKLIEESLPPDSNLFATALKDFELDQNDWFNAFNQSGFADFEIDPDMVLKLNSNWKRYADYLQAFSAKYRLRANNAESKSEQLVVRNFNVDEIKSQASPIEFLFNEVLQNSPVRIAGNTAKYFEKLKKELQEHFIFKAFIHDNKLVAFSTAIVNDNCMHAHHIGFDYSLNKNFALYQNILYHYVKDGIELKKSYINFGRDAMEIKSTVGATPLPLKLYVKFSSSLTHLLFESFLKLAKTKEWTQRRPFKV